MKTSLAVSERQVAQALTVQNSIELARRAYVKLAKSQVIQPLRSWFTVPHGATFYFMPALVTGTSTVSIKVVSVNLRNPKLGLPSTSATIFVFDAKTGEEIARIAGDSLTAIRTAASSTLATDVLARRDADSLGIVGTGIQAQAHLRAMLCVRKFKRVLVYSRSKAHREAFLRKFSKFKVQINAASSAGDIARSSDVIVLATSSPIPLFRGALVRPGSHVSAIGSGLPNSREVDTTLVRKSVLVVDSKPQAFASYGEILLPLKAGAISRSHVRASLGDLLLHPSRFQRRENDITLFKAGGLAVLDAVFADYIVSKYQK